MLRWRGAFAARALRAGTTASSRDAIAISSEPTGVGSLASSRSSADPGIICHSARENRPSRSAPGRASGVPACGVPIRIGGTVVGAIGVSGAASAQQDNEIANAAAASADAK